MPHAIRITLNQLGRHAVLVADMHGKRVYSANVSGPSQFEIPGLQNGVYFVKVGGLVRRVNLY